MSVKEILIKARSLIERGWTQRHFYEVKNGKDCYCAAGAIRQASDSPEESEAAIDVLWEIIPGPVTLWNDGEGMTQAKVLEVFDAAIALCEKEENQHVG